METAAFETKKIVVIGDGACGKTSLLMVYIDKKFPTEYIPTVFDSYIKETDINGAAITTLLMDTSGQEDYERLRALQYIDTDVFVLCFAIDNRVSFQNIKNMWIKEIKRYQLPYVLVGTKSDLRNLETNTVKTQEGEEMAKKIKAVRYLECSAKLMEGVDDVFKTAVRTALNKKVKRACFFV